MICFSFGVFHCHFLASALSNRCCLILSCIYLNELLAPEILVNIVFALSFSYSTAFYLQAIEWIREVGEVYLNTHTHTSGDQHEAEKLLAEHTEFVNQHAKVSSVI